MNNIIPILLVLAWVSAQFTAPASTIGFPLTKKGVFCNFPDSGNKSKIPINTYRSLIFWKGTKMSGRHEGTVHLKEGYLKHSDGRITGGRFIADMHSIAITDIPKYEPVPRKRLRDHLKSEDFFYVEKYPTASFSITRTELLNDKQIRIWGNLSIRDVTKSISFIASKKYDLPSGPELNARFKIDRFQWNIAYQGSYWEKLTSIIDNNLVDDEIQLSIRLILYPFGD